MTTMSRTVGSKTQLDM